LVVAVDIAPIVVVNPPLHGIPRILRQLHNAASKRVLSYRWIDVGSFTAEIGADPDAESADGPTQVSPARFQPQLSP